jgi:DNA-binding transcriptional LysR family regulator
MSIDLRLIRYFVTTADTGSVTAAAVELHLTQPALSRQLRLLEQHHGVSLFERVGRGLRLSRAGEEFLPWARELLQRADEVERAVEGLATGRLAHLHMAMPTTTLTDVVAPWIATFGPDDPVPTIRQLDPGGALAALRLGADLAIVTRPPSPALASRRLAVLPIWAYVRAEDPWARRPEVTLEELVERPLLLPPQAYRPRALLDAAVDAAGLAYRDMLECTSTQIAQALAAAGRGVAVVSDDPRFDLTPVPIRGTTGRVRIHLYAAWDAAHHAAPALAEFAERLAAFIAERYADAARG